MKWLWGGWASAFVVFLFLSAPGIILAAEVLPAKSDLVSAGAIAAGAEKEQAEEQPVGSSRERTSSDVFGRRGGIIHPFLAVTEYYTDNVFYTRDNRKSDFATILSPGIWLALPHVYEKLLKIDTSNISPGGFSLSKPQEEDFKRYQLYLFYNADIERFSKYSSEDTVSHRAEGSLQYNLRGGLSLEVIDQFIASHDARGTGITTELDKFRSNLASITTSYEVSERFKLRVDYTNFFLDYTADRNNFRDRDDNALSGYVFYKVQPKTSLFLQYEFLDITYREDNSFDSREHHWFGGVQWNVTAKSKGSVKAGYGIKDFAHSSSGSSNDFILEAQMDYQFTPKTSVILKASRKTNETNIENTDFILSNTMEVQYLQKLTGKIMADIKFAYSNDTYKEDLTFDGVTKRLEDNYYLGVFALQYKFKEWLQLDLGYVYDRRDSNFADFDYTNNTAFLRVTGSL